MATLAIRGHKTRGNEVIEILKMFGAEGDDTYKGCNRSWVYIINGGYVDWDYPSGRYTIYTLEEFLEKFPYKVGDKVQHKGATSCGSVYVIERMKWANNHIEYEIRPLYDYNHTGLVTLCVENLQPYKEMIAIKENSFENLQTEGVLVKAEKTITTEEFNHNSKEWIIDRLACMSADDALHNISNLYDELHKPQFPTTYEECCKVLNIIQNNKLVFSNPNEESEYAYRNLALYNSFDKLKICRDAYWKIAGDWKPDWEDDTNKYVIANYKNHIVLDVRCHSSTKLSFPTKEMRDAFYQNFKELIEECKELL